MNSIASPKRTSAAPAAPTTQAALRTAATVVATAIFAVLLISFRPFTPAPPPGVSIGGDTVNQLGFGALGALSIFGFAALADPRKLVALVSPWWLALIGFLVISAFHAIDPSAAMRSVSFTLIGILAIGAVLALPRDAEAYSTVFAVAGLATVALCFFGVIALPGIAIHGSDGFEAQHAGFWRGSFSHKNIAGPVMACLSFAGLYLFRRGWRWIGALLFAGAFLFLANTGSKTTLFLVPLPIAIVMLPGFIGMRFLAPLFFALSVIGFGLATLGTVFIAPLKAFANAEFPDLTYTGRTALWEFGGQMLEKKPWFGYGYESFWGTPIVTTTDQHFDRGWDIRGIVHGHDGYLDIAINMGLLALVFGVIALLIMPARDYLKAPRLKENVYLADFFMMVLYFTSLNAFLETFFFRRADPVWLFLVFAVLGLRLVARVPIPSGPIPSGQIGGDGFARRAGAS